MTASSASRSIGSTVSANGQDRAGPLAGPAAAGTGFEWGGDLRVIEQGEAAPGLYGKNSVFDQSEQFDTPVILRLTTRICHVKAVVVPGQREERPATGFRKEPARRPSCPWRA